MSKQTLHRVLHGILPRLLYLRAKACLRPLQRARRSRFLAEANRRWGLSLFDVKALSQPLALYSTELSDANALYGALPALREYSGYRRECLASIEHGLYFGKYVHPWDADYHGCDRLITMSQYRREVIEATGRLQAITVGPYVHYAPPSLSEKETERLERELGTTLLVMPAHSIEGGISEFNLNEFLEFIRSKQGEFDTTCVCLYWKDVTDEIIARYRALGCRITCAGHSHDPAFLARLKSIIGLSDMVVTNTLGTHVGYAAHLAKPLYLFPQEVTLSGEHFEKVVKRDDTWKRNYRDEVKKFEQAFAFWRVPQTNQQRELVRYYFGTDCVLSSEELRLCLAGTRKPRSMTSQPVPGSDAVETAPATSRRRRRTVESV